MPKKGMIKPGEEPIYPVRHNWDDECWEEMRMDQELNSHFNQLEVMGKGNYEDKS